MGDESFVRATPLGFGAVGAAAASTKVGLIDRAAALGVFRAIFGGVLGGSIPGALGTCPAAFGAPLNSFTGVLGFSARFFGGVFGADVGIAFFFGGGGIGPWPLPVVPGKIGGATGGRLDGGAASLCLGLFFRGSSGSSPRPMPDRSEA